MKILHNKDEICTNLIKRKKKKKGKKSQNSLEWWGLAENIKIEQKYRIPNPPNILLAGIKRTNSQTDQSPTSHLLSHKITYLKKRVLEGEIEQLQQEY